jgi:hypothetical protein
LLLIELTTLETLSQVLGGSGAECLAERQLVEFLADNFTIFVSHNFFTYK